MYNSCNTCKSNCCRHGKGPYKLLPPEEYLENYGAFEAYNTKCLALDDKGRCRLWGTAELPQECRTFVCTSKVYTKEQLSIISNVEEESCPNCDAKWLIVEKLDKNVWEKRCEICGLIEEWVFTRRS